MAGAPVKELLEVMDRATTVIDLYMTPYSQEVLLVLKEVVGDDRYKKMRSDTHDVGKGVAVQRK